MGFAIAATDDGTQRTEVTVAQFPATGPFNNADMPVQLLYPAMAPPVFMHVILGC